MKYLIYLILLVMTSNSIKAQNYESPKNWFLGIKYDNAISRVELVPDKELYKATLQNWLTTLSNSENLRRESWLVSGADKSTEPDEEVLVESDFEYSSAKFDRMYKKAKENDLLMSKLTLQLYLLRTYKFEKNKVEFDKKGEIKDVVLYKSISDINSYESKFSFGELKKILSSVYGQPNRNVDDGSLYYDWVDSSVKLILVANLKESYYAIIYNVKK